PETYIFSAGTGRLLHVGTDQREVRTADLDGDGVPDLVVYRPDNPSALDRGGKLEMLRGRSPEAWRRLGGAWQPADDLDGDGIPDLVTALPGEGAKKIRGPRRPAGVDRGRLPEQPRATAISGRDGRVLWQCEPSDGGPYAALRESFHKRLLPA